MSKNVGNLSRMEAIAMQELSSEDQRHLENQTEGEPSDKNGQLTPEQPCWSRRKRKQKGRACAKQQTNLKKRAQNRPSVWTLMTSVLKVMWKFCTTTYDIASDFLQGKQALLWIFPKLSTWSLNGKHLFPLLLFNILIQGLRFTNTHMAHFVYDVYKMLCQGDFTCIQSNKTLSGQFVRYYYQ